LVGWYLHPPVSSGRASSQEDDLPGSGLQTEPLQQPIETILLCHGNAENVAQSAAYIGDRLRSTLNAEVFVFDYRGFGKSEGVPDERGVLEDAEAALEWFQKKSGKSPSEMILVPWLPIRYVMRNQFHSVDWIRDFSGPVFQSHGAADRLIPISMGRDLFDAAPTGNKQFIAVEGMSHLDPLPEDYWGQLLAYIDSL